MSTVRGKKIRFNVFLNGYFLLVKPELFTQNDMLVSSVGGDIDLKCKVEAFPLPIIYWTDVRGILN